MRGVAVSRSRTPLESFARRLRQESTGAEKKLWSRLRDRRLASAKFRRQLPIGPYIADFACVEAQLIVELDGGQHADRAEHDEARSAFLNSKGFRVLRFWNNDVLLNIEGVLTVILQALDPSPQPSPLERGEGDNNS